MDLTISLLFFWLDFARCNAADYFLEDGPCLCYEGPEAFGEGEFDVGFEV
jgi:hypothetical protein